MVPHTLAAILPSALVEEAVDLRDLATLLARRSCVITVLHASPERKRPVNFPFACEARGYPEEW